MIDDDTAGPRQLRDAAVVRSVRAEMDRALADLAVRPLDEAVGERMRRLLDSKAPTARAALQRLDTPGSDSADASGDVA